MRRVVVTGLGCVCPIGNNANEMWDSILLNKCGIDLIKSFDTTDFKVKVAGEIKDLDMAILMDPKSIKTNDKFTLYARIAANEAVKDSKLDTNAIDKSRFGCILSSGIGGLATIAENEDVLTNKGPSRISPYFIPKSLANIASGQIAIDHGCNGYTSCVVTACAASTNAIGDAMLRIRYDQEDIMLVGGSEAAITPLGVAGFQALRALSTETDPNKASIPFDKNRSGFVMGEGAGILVLEELEHAKKRGAHIYCEVVGYGASCDAHHITAPKEDGSGAILAINKSLKDANIKPSDISYINAHGTSTHLNDMGEANAIKSVFGCDTPVSSTKSNTGHLLGAAGAIEAIICAKAIENSVIPATINTTDIDSECDVNVIINKNINKKLEYVMSNSLGFGGHNASIILKRFGD